MVGADQETNCPPWKRQGRRDRGLPREETRLKVQGTLRGGKEGALGPSMKGKGEKGQDTPLEGCKMGMEVPEGDRTRSTRDPGNVHCKEDKKPSRLGHVR